MRTLHFALLCATAVIAMFAQPAQASPFTLIERVGFAAEYGDPESRSFDGPGFNPYTAILPFTDGKYYELGPIIGDGSLLTVELLMEVTAYADSNKLFLEDENGAQTVLIDGPDPITTRRSLRLTQGTTFNAFAQSPTGTYGASDAIRNDGPHLIALLANRSGIGEISRVNSAGDRLVFGVEAGDVFLFFEDLKGGWPPRAPFLNDWDNQDQVTKLSAQPPQPVPEPQPSQLITLGLLGLGAGQFRRRARANG